MVCPQTEFVTLNDQITALRDMNVFNVKCPSLYLKISKGISRLFMMIKEIINVIFVTNTFLEKVVLKCISRQSMKEKEITNVIIVK